MAISPILLNSLPFDATLSHTLQFTYSGSQVFGHRVIIKNNTTNATVYDKKNDALNTLVEIPANTLINGNAYNFQVSVFDHEDIESPFSNSIVLKCLATPSFVFSNITEGMTVRNSYIDAELSYFQADGELLNAYTVLLYAANKETVIYNSGEKYSSDVLSVHVPELVDDTTYYLRATGQTVNGMEMDTGLIQILCDYIKPDIFLKFRADNIADEGIVRLTSNFVIIEGKSIPEELAYIDDEKVSLINGEKVYWDDGFEASNFTFEIVAENLIDYSKIVTFNMKNVMAYVTWNVGEFEGDDSPTYYAELTAYQYIGSNRLNYIQVSNRISPLVDGERAHIWIRHVDGAFDIRIGKYESEVVA